MANIPNIKNASTLLPEKYIYYSSIVYFYHSLRGLWQLPIICMIPIHSPNKHTLYSCPCRSQHFFVFFINNCKLKICTAQINMTNYGILSHFLIIFRIPNTYRTVRSTACKLPAVRAEGYAVDPVCMTSPHEPHPALKIPDLYPHARCAAYNLFPIGAEGYATGPVCTGFRKTAYPKLQIPYPQTPSAWSRTSAMAPGSGRAHRRRRTRRRPE